MLRKTRRRVKRRIKNHFKWKFIHAVKRGVIGAFLGL